MSSSKGSRGAQQMHDVLLGTAQLVANLARHYSDARDVLYLGRG